MTDTHDSVIEIGPGRLPDSGGLALYIHLPFCRTICPYCNFAVALDRKSDVDQYHQALKREIAQRLSSWGPTQIDTIYFGGGTPGRTSPKHLAALMETVRTMAPIHPAAEITLEANPDDVTAANLGAWQRLGVNRISLGVQSFDPVVLKRLGRAHTRDLIETSIGRIADADISMSIDLIYGAPDQTIDSFLSDVDRILSHDQIGHMSAYALTIESGTPYASPNAQRTLSFADDSLVAQMYHQLCDHLRQHGWAHYEISNASRPGDRAQHNSRYWDRSSYLGCGLGAHSFVAVEQRRQANTATLDRYIALIERDGTALADEEILSDTECLMEVLLLGLRTQDGVRIEPMEGLLSAAPWVVSAINDQIFVIEGDRIRLAEEHWIVADDWTLRLHETLSRCVVRVG